MCDLIELLSDELHVIRRDNMVALKPIYVLFGLLLSLEKQSRNGIHRPHLFDKVLVFLWCRLC